jgi:hypothetical protein
MNADFRKIHLPLIFTDNADQESHSRFQEQAAIPCKIPTDGRTQNNPAYGAGKSCGLSKQAESGGAGRGAWEISPAK